MGLFSIFSGRKASQAQVLGNITLRYNKSLHCWGQDGIEFWGTPEVDLSIDAGETGPSPDQVDEFWRLIDAKNDLLPRLLGALQEMENEAAQFVLVGVHIPKLDGSKAGELSRFWFDRLADDHFIYGVESNDRWQTLIAHRDD